MMKHTIAAATMYEVGSASRSAENSVVKRWTGSTSDKQTSSYEIES